eukprot:4440030-Pyramimonas_sp.AAC.1
MLSKASKVAQDAHPRMPSRGQNIKVPHVFQGVSLSALFGRISLSTGSGFENPNKPTESHKSASGRPKTSPTEPPADPRVPAEGPATA